MKDKKGRKGLIVVVVHKSTDLDGREAKVFLEQLGTKIDQMIFWGGEKIQFSSGVKEVIFLDCFPEKDLVDRLKKRKIKLTVFDHHPHGDYPDPLDKRYPHHTTTSLIAKTHWKQLNLSNGTILRLIRWSKRADFKTGGDPMNIANLIRFMNLFYSDDRVQEWAEKAVQSNFCDGGADFKKGREFFLDSLRDFLDRHPKLSSNDIIGKFLRRTEKNGVFEDSMNIAAVTARVRDKYGEKETRKWLSLTLRAIEKKQQKFEEARKEVKSSVVSTTGESVVVVGVSNNPMFNQAAREYAKRIYQRVPIVAKICPDNKGFQIFSDGFNDLRELVKALRVEVLKSRKREIPSDWEYLQQAGIVQGTDPLYYHKAGYSTIMWGSLTKPSVRKVDIPEQVIKETIMKVLDLEFFPSECLNNSTCLGGECGLFDYRLQRCAQYRKENNHYQNDRQSLPRELKLGPAITVRFEN